MNFTEKDRSLILKLAQRQREQDARIKKLEKQYLAKPAPVKKLEVKSEKAIEHAGTRGDITLTFADMTKDQPMRQKVLIESLYLTLTELCDKNGIESLKINISK
jgi:hypothetical protein